MGFESAKTVEQVLKEIHSREYLMPAIQREFVWNTDDVVWWQPTRGADYRIFNASDAAALAAEFAEHHRTQLLPR